MMAFGVPKGTLKVNQTSITDPCIAVGSVSVAVDDLVFAVLGQETNLTVTAWTDNLGNTYTPLNAGNDSLSVTARAAWSLVTVAGTLTAVNGDTTASTNNSAHVAVVIEGPFAASPLDANPANATDDLESPLTCPTTGTLAQADEVVLAFVAINNPDAISATSPNLLAEQDSSAAGPRVAISYQLVAATTAVIPEFTVGVNPTRSVLGTASFKKAAAAAAGAPASGGLGIRLGIGLR